MARLPLLFCLVSTHPRTTRPRGMDHVIPLFPRERRGAFLASHLPRSPGWEPDHVDRSVRGDLPETDPNFPWNGVLLHALALLRCRSFLLSNKRVLARVHAFVVSTSSVTNGCSSLFHGIAPSCFALRANRVVTCCILVLCLSSHW